MDKNTEEKFVRTFLESRVQDRIIFELAHDKKRKTAIERFCHTTDKIIKTQFILNQSKKLDSNEIFKIVSGLSTDKSCYIISWYEEIDGSKTIIAKGLSRCIGLGMPSVIIVNERVVIIETEQEQGPANKYILYAK